MGPMPDLRPEGVNSSTVQGLEVANQNSTRNPRLLLRLHPQDGLRNRARILLRCAEDGPGTEGVAIQWGYY